MKDNIKQLAVDHIASEKNTTMECLLVKLSLGCLQQISYQRHGMFQKEVLQHMRRNEFSIKTSTKTADLMGVAVEDVERPRHPDQGEASQHLHLSPHLIFCH